MRNWPQPALRPSSRSESLEVTMLLLYVGLCYVAKKCCIDAHAVPPSGHGARMGATDA